MGGVVKPVVKAVGLAKENPSSPAGQELKKVMPEVKASRMDEEQGARMRGARRRGRALLSDARLNPDAGSETLGGGQTLG